jgi:hypothetical protein
MASACSSMAHRAASRPAAASADAALAGALVTGGRLGRGEARRDPAVHLGYGCIKVQIGPLALGP